MFTVQSDSERVLLQQHDEQGVSAQAEVYLFGALPNRYAVRRRDGSLFDVLAAYDSPQQARERITAGFYSAKLSPFVCRLKQGIYRFDGQEYRTGKHLLGGHAIHGLLYDAPFAVSGSGQQADGAWVELTYGYGGSDGYPFPYRLNVRYTLAADGLHICTTAANTGDRPLPLADGWHPYFRLGGSVDDWTLQINSRRQLEFDAELLPNGREREDTRFVHGTALRGIELDNSFVLEENGGPACLLRGNGLQLSLHPDRSYPILQVYIPPERHAVALENLSGAPDCLNNGIGLLVLPPGGEHRFSTRYLLAETD